MADPCGGSEPAGAPHAHDKAPYEKRIHFSWKQSRALFVVSFLLAAILPFFAHAMLFVVSILCVLAFAVLVETSPPLPAGQSPGPGPATQSLSEEPHASTASTYLAVIGFSVFLVFAYIYMVENMPNRYSGGTLTACKSNLKNLGTAMEMYSTDNEGRYPKTISKITPDYLKTLPTCPASGTMTYCYIYTAVPDVYTMWCNSTAHVRVSGKANYPQYDAVQGLIE
ncbi:MAG: hypothetical protein RDV48_21970 [Candidatus Eremiobacteraeota bacterium]|nr:hypothetical protein [Candidatus Eremiobacteraeota bacterium]